MKIGGGGDAGARSGERGRRLAGRGMGTRHTPTGGRGEGGEVGGRVAYMYMLPEISRPGIVVARRKGGAAHNLPQPPSSTPTVTVFLKVVRGPSEIQVSDVVG